VVCYVGFSTDALAIAADPLNATESCKYEYIVFRRACYSPALPCIWHEAGNRSSW